MTSRRARLAVEEIRILSVGVLCSPKKGTLGEFGASDNRVIPFY